MSTTSKKSFSFGDLALRVVFSIVLVLVTYNPTGTSYIHWLFNHAEGNLPFVALAGVALLICYAIYIRSTLRSLGALGIGLAAALIAAIIWVLNDLGVLALDGSGTMQWIVLIGIGIILGIGVSWSHIRRLLSGQADVDDVDE